MDRRGLPSRSRSKQPIDEGAGVGDDEAQHGVSMVAGEASTSGDPDVIVLDDHHDGETGMQRSQTACGIDLAGMSEACGLPESAVCRTAADVDGLRAMLHAPATGPRLFDVTISAENPARTLPSRDAVHVRNRFRTRLAPAAA